MGTKVAAEKRVVNTVFRAQLYNHDYRVREMRKQLVSKKKMEDVQSFGSCARHAQLRG
ncbi:MAG: hypothetical protein RJQ08_08605 [Salinisphaeraceae bacterium]